MRINPRSYVLPYADGVNYGVRLSMGVPTRVVEELEGILRAATDLHDREAGGVASEPAPAPAPPPRRSSKASAPEVGAGDAGGGGGGGGGVDTATPLSARLAAGLGQGGAVVAAGLVAGAKMAGTGIK